MSHPGRNELHRSSARLAYAVALALAGAAPAHVLAQAAPPPPAVPAIPATPPENLPNTPAGEKETQELETIVVTGFRASLEVSLDMKRESAASVDTILAEDIAKFPDLNLAEAIQRIPGVAIARDAGEGRNISVRGLGPQFTRVRINGMEALSTAGGTDAAGGTNRSRAFDFNVFASELFNSITVTQDGQCRHGGGLARRNRGPAHRQAVRLPGQPVRHVVPGRLQRPERRGRSAHGPAGERAICRRDDRRDGLHRVCRTEPVRRRREHGALAVGRLRAAGSHVPGHAARCRRSTLHSTPASRATTTTSTSRHVSASPARCSTSRRRRRSSAWTCCTRT